MAFSILETSTFSKNSMIMAPLSPASASSSLDVLLQAGSLSSMLLEAASQKNGLVNLAATAVTVSSSSCPSDAGDGGSSVTTASEEDIGSGGSITTEPQGASTTPANGAEGRFRGRTVEDRLKRSRERNRVHARKTRQRKKEQMQSLQSKADVLKKEQVQLKTAINEKNTANILCALFAKNDKADKAEDPRVEALLRRPTDDIPDATKLTGLDPLILPSGAPTSKKNGKEVADGTISAYSKEELPDDGIDYELLGKDRTKCTPAELDRIRRERNRMHAKRTRDRKRHFMEEMTDMCKTLESENILLRHHLMGLNGGVLPQLQRLPQLLLPEQQHSAAISPSLPPSSPTNTPTGFREIKRGKRSLDDVAAAAPTLLKPKPASTKPESTATPTTSLGQLGTLLQVATGTSVRTYHPYSSGSDSSEDEGSGSERRPLAFKRQRKLSASSDEAYSRSVATTSSMTSIGV